MCLSKRVTNREGGGERERERARRKVEVAFCRIVAGFGARLNEAEGRDIWWHILGNSLHICIVQLQDSSCAHLVNKCTK